MVKKKLGDIAEITSGARVGRFNESDSNRMTPVLKSKFLEDSYTLDFEFKSISDKLDSQYYSKNGDILFLLSEPNTVTMMRHEGFVIPLYFAIIRVKEGYNSSFVYHYLKSNKFKRELHKLSGGTSLKMITVNNLKNITVKVPDYEKQEKYGELLDLIDEKINLNKKLIYYDEKIKEGIMGDILG